MEAGSFLFYAMNYGSLVVGAAAGLAGLLLAIKSWRYLVVKKFRWMTEDQVEAYLKRIAERG